MPQLVSTSLLLLNNNNNKVSFQWFTILRICRDEQILRCWLLRQMENKSYFQCEKVANIMKALREKMYLYLRLSHKNCPNIWQPFGPL